MGEELEGKERKSVKVATRIHRAASVPSPVMKRIVDMLASGSLLGVVRVDGRWHVNSASDWSGWSLMGDVVISDRRSRKNRNHEARPQAADDARTVPRLHL